MLITFWLACSFSSLIGQGAYSVMGDMPDVQLDEDVKLLGEYDNRLLFFNVDGNSNKLWVSDATVDGTYKLGVAEQEKISLISITDTIAYFVEEIGSVYHISKLTPDKDTLVSFHSSNESIRRPILWNGSIYYVVDSPTSFNGDDLIRLNLEDNTSEILFTSDFGGIRGLGATDTDVMFIASMDEGKMLGKSDGTIANTSTFHMLYPSGSEFGGSVFMKSDGVKMYFAYHPSNDPYNLWVSDGTSSGTMILKEYDRPAFGMPDNPFAFLNGQFFYILREADAPSGSTFELHTTDGTVGGTINLNPGNTDYLHPRQLTIFKNKIYFNSLFSNWALMSTDGTVSGTETVISPFGNQNGGLVGRVFDNGLYNDSLVIRAFSDQHGSELFITDGTDSGTRLLADILPGTESSNPSQFIQVGDLLYFITSIGNDNDLWVYDPLYVSALCDDFLVDSVIVNNAVGSNLGSIEVQVVGGKEPYTYKFDDNAATSNPLLENLMAGSFNALITDANNCELDTLIEVKLETKILDLGKVGSYKVFPNPSFSNNLNLSMTFVSSISKVNIDLYDIVGEKVFQERNVNVNGNYLDHTIPIDNLLSGEYILFVSSGNQKLISDKVTVLK